jgi:methyl-accepting chemotaxis protein
MWTFGRKIAIGFAVSFVLLLGIGTISYRGIDSLTRTSYLVAHSHKVLEHLASLSGLMKDAETGQRGFVITGQESYLEPYQEAVQVIPTVIKELRDLIADNPAQQKRLEVMLPLVNAKLQELKNTVEMRRKDGRDAATARVQTGIGKKFMDDMRTIAAEMALEERGLLAERAEDVEKASGNARITIVYGTLFCVVFVCAAGFIITRSLTREIASAVRHVQQSSAELQSASTQQAAGARESATAMTEITTTISELLATSRQIAESAQRVATVAEQTLGATRTGEVAVTRSNDSISGIRQQVDVIVNHMLDLGKKSQQIGAVLDIVSELAEQTNILAINATIEASGAGESGKRFAVVADEIRKLADRVAGSTKEIRHLIDDIRSAVNTTVMATETGSKSVDSGSRMFGEVALAFNQITSLIATTTEAAREIELSTKQQTSAVEQVNLAIASTAQATKETEASSSQTFQTASQLAGLSKDLLRLVQPQTVS